VRIVIKLTEYLRKEQII